MKRCNRHLRVGLSGGAGGVMGAYALWVLAGRMPGRTALDPTRRPALRDGAGAPDRRCFGARRRPRGAGNGAQQWQENVESERRARQWRPRRRWGGRSSVEPDMPYWALRAPADRMG